MGNLRQIANNDLNFILTKDENGFRWPVTLRSPDQQIYKLYCFSNDIGDVIDPDTGVILSGRSASIALSLDDLRANNIKDFPVAEHSETRKPWDITFDDIGCKKHKFTIQDTSPDLALGVVVLKLALYE